MVIYGYVKAEISPLYMLHYVKCIEQYLGRSNGARWGARVLDIDILLWGNNIIDSAVLKIPHPGFFHRDFVLVPLMEIMPSFYLGNKIFFVKELVKDIPSSHITRITESVQC
jgi:2-amino-4-hydroxy-6-hydroxymethyldihydropteridine diphosphokinase